VDALLDWAKEQPRSQRTRLDVLAGPGPRCVTRCALAVGATCMFYLQRVDDPDKLRAIVLETATDLIS
jgi:hypothetical protein